VAGLLKSDVPAGSKVVCVLTGNGLKDPDVAIGGARPPEVVEATIDSVLGALTL
jgi:threonine synthase